MRMPGYACTDAIASWGELDLPLSLYDLKDSSYWRITSQYPLAVTHQVLTGPWTSGDRERFHFVLSNGEKKVLGLLAGAER